MFFFVEFRVITMTVLEKLMTNLNIVLWKISTSQNFMNKIFMR